MTATFPPIPFTIPHHEDVVFEDQAKPDKIDFDIMLRAGLGWSWLSGCEMTPQESPDLTINVAAGAVAFGDRPWLTPAGIVTFLPNSLGPRFGLIGADYLPIISFSRSGTTITMKLGMDPVTQGWTVGEGINIATGNTICDITNGTLLSVTSNGDGTGNITYTNGTGTVVLTPQIGWAVHIGVWHGTPQTTEDKPKFPMVPQFGAVILGAVYLRPAEAGLTVDFIIDKRIPRRGAVQTVLNPMEFPYLAKNDGVTYDGDAVESCIQDAHHRGVAVYVPGGGLGYNMVNGTTPKEIVLDFGLKPVPGDLHIKGDGRFGRSTLLYTNAIFPPNLDPSDPSDGDPGGRVPGTAIRAININSATGTMRLESLDLVGPYTSPKSSDATDLLAMGLRQYGAGVGMGGGGRTHCIDVNVSNFFCGFYDRLDNNHNFLTFCQASSNWYGEYFATSASRTKYNSANGDHCRIGCFMSANVCSSIASDPAGLIFDACWYSGHFGTSRFGFYQEFGVTGNIVLPSNATYARSAAGLVSIDTKWSSSPSWPVTSGFQTAGPYNWPAAPAATTIRAAGSGGASDGLSLPQTSLDVVDNSGLSAIGGVVSIFTPDHGIQSVTFAGLSGAHLLTGCTGGKGLLVGGNLVIESDLTTSQPPALLYPGMPYPTLWGLMVGDVLDLTTLAGRIAAGTPPTGWAASGAFGATGNVGVIASISGNVITLVMGDYVDATHGTDSQATAIATTTIPAIGAGVGEMIHAYNDADWLREVGMFDTSLEGCGESFVFSAGGTGSFQRNYGYWALHGNECFDRNHGGMQILPLATITSAARKWNRGTGTETAPQNGDIYQVVMTVPSGHGVVANDIICTNFNSKITGDRTGNTVLGSDTISNLSAVLPDQVMLLGAAITGPGIPAGAIIDTINGAKTQITITDFKGNRLNCSATAAGITISFWDDFFDPTTLLHNSPNANPTRATGKVQVVATTGTTITYEQIYNPGRKNHPYTGTTAVPYALGAGKYCQVQGFRVGKFDDCEQLNLDLEKETRSGPALSENQLNVKTMRNSTVTCTQGVMPWVRLQAQTVSDLNFSFPVNSQFLVGRARARVGRVLDQNGLIPGAVVEVSGVEEMQRFSGGYVAGISLYSSPPGDYCIVLEHGPMRSEDVDFGTVLTTDATIAPNDVLAGDPNNPGLGYVMKARPGDQVIGRSTKNAAGASSPYTLGGLSVGIVNTPSAAATVEIVLLDTQTALSVVNEVGNFRFSIPALLNGKSLQTASAFVFAASSSGLPTLMIRNVTTGLDLLSTAITIDATELDSATAATPSAVWQTRKVVHTGDQLRVDCTVAGTGTLGLGVRLTFG